MYSPSAHSRFRRVCFFIRTDLEKFSITSLAHQCVFCSKWVPSEWESKQLKKQINNPHHSSPSVHVLWSKYLCLQEKNASLKYVFTLNSCSNTNPLSIILLPPMKMSSCLNQERIMHKSSVYTCTSETIQKSSKQMFFINCLNSHSDGTHSLQRTQICSDEKPNSCTCWMAWVNKVHWWNCFYFAFCNLNIFDYTFHNQHINLSTKFNKKMIFTFNIYYIILSHTWQQNLNCMNCKTFVTFSDILI